MLTALQQRMSFSRWVSIRPTSFNHHGSGQGITYLGGVALTDLLAQIDEKTTRLKEKTAQLTNAAQHLQTMPGVGPMIALAIEAFAPATTTFRSGRDFAAWLGLVPLQFSSGGKDRLGRVSKAGQTDIRTLLIIGAMSHVRVASRKPAATGSWLARMLARKPKMLVAIALANKMARRIWAMLTKQEDYRE